MSVGISQCIPLAGSDCIIQKGIKSMVDFVNTFTLKKRDSKNSKIQVCDYKGKM